MSELEEKKNQRIGMGVSIGVHALLLVFFFLIMAWREPDPPVPEYGIEINFGMDAVGTGDIQPQQPTAAEEVPVPEEVIQEQEVQDEIIDEPIENVPVEEAEETPEETVVEDSEMEDSPDIIEPVETIKVPVEEIPEPIEEKVIEETAKIVEEDVTETEDDPTGTAVNSETEVESAGQGDDTEVAGDKGDPEASLDSRALYGSQGGGGGPLLELSGWIWDFEPDPKDTSNENGKIVFEIKIDDRGEIISVITLEKTVSPAVERIYRQEVESLTFSPISSNTIPAPVSTGKITFIIRSK